MGYTQIPVDKYGPAQGYVLRIVLHGTVSPTVRGGARAVARYFRDSAVEASAHYIVDPGEVVQCVPEDQQAWHDGWNANEVGIELCDPQSGPGSRWADADHQAMLRLAAQLVREVASRWQFARPLRRGIAPLDLSVECVTGHVDVARTTRTTDHTDPGQDFPWDQFMSLVNGPAAPAEPAVPAVPLVGGLSTDAPSTCGTPGVPGRLDLVCRGRDGAVWHRWLTPTQPGAWESLGGFCWGPPSLCCPDPGRYDVVCRGRDNRVWHKTWTPAAGWSAWEDLGGAVLGVSIAVVGPGRWAVTATGLDGHMWVKTWTGQAWTAWQPALPDVQRSLA